jgi:hypothetical protein
VLACFWLALIPWSLVSAWRGRPLLVASLDKAFARAVAAFLALMLLRWGIVLAVVCWGGAAPPF